MTAFLIVWAGGAVVALMVETAHERTRGAVILFWPLFAARALKRSIVRAWKEQD